MTQQMVDEYLMFFQNNIRSKFTIAQIKLCSFTNLISQKFSDSAVILATAVSKRCTQDLPVVNKQGSRTYHSSMVETFVERLLFHCTCWLSIDFLSSSALLGLRKALEQDAMSSSVSVVHRLENS